MGITRRGVQLEASSKVYHQRLYVKSILYDVPLFLSLESELFRAGCIKDTKSGRRP